MGALQMKLQQKRAATRARTYGGQLEASRNAPRRTPSPQTSSAIKALQMKLQQKRAATRARTYGGQLEASRKAPRRTPSPQTSSAINAIHMKLQQEKAAILAKYPEYETWAEYQADMTPDMIRH